MNTEKHTIAVAQLRMVLAWTGGNKWIDSKDIKETKSRGLGAWLPWRNLFNFAHTGPPGNTEHTSPGRTGLNPEHNRPSRVV